jgi:hypothetical protein
VDSEYHSIGVGGRQSQVHVLGRDGYGNVGALGLGNGAFDGYVIYFSVIVLALSLGVKIGSGAPSDCKDCTISWESFVLLLRFVDLWCQNQYWGP